MKIVIVAICVALLFGMVAAYQYDYEYDEPRGRPHGHRDHHKPPHHRPPHHKPPHHKPPHHKPPHHKKCERKWIEPDKCKCCEKMGRKTICERCDCKAYVPIEYECPPCKHCHHKPPHHKPPHGKPPHGKPPHGKPPHGEPPHHKPPHGKPPHHRPGHDEPPRNEHPCDKHNPHKCHFKCPKSELVAFKMIYEAADGPNWKKRWGWKCFDHGLHKCPPLCDRLEKYPKNSYYKGNYYGLTCKDGYPVELDLSDNRLEGRIHPAIGCLEYVKKIDLRDNRLKGKIPHTIGWNKDWLQYLYLQGNKLCKATPGLCDLKFCHDIDISDNHINKWELPHCLQKTQCKYGVQV